MFALYTHEKMASGNTFEQANNPITPARHMLDRITIGCIYYSCSCFEAYVGLIKPRAVILQTGITFFFLIPNVIKMTVIA